MTPRLAALLERVRPPRIPVIELHGVLAGREGALNLRAAGPAIRQAMRSAPKGGDVVLDIDSPGGSPVQSDLIGRLIRREAERRSVTVHAVIGEVGASGGYWLACAADRIRANPMSIVGSIGVIGGGFGFPAVLARSGIERRLYTAGENKARLDPFSPERPEDVVFVRRLMDDIHGRFKDWVRLRRGDRLSAATAPGAGETAGEAPPGAVDVFDGSFFLGDHARRLGLIDGLGDLDELVQELGGPRAQRRVFRPKRRGRLLARLIGRAAAEGAVEGALGVAEAMARPRL